MKLVGAAYNMPAALRLSGPLEVGALERSFGQLMARHESLRTRFELQQGQPVQVIEGCGEFRLPVWDVSGEATAERQRLTRERLQQEIERPFDLKSGPLLRVLLVRQSESEHVLLLTMHHIVSDGWSLLGVLPRELGELYAANVQGREPRLAPLPVQYADYALWQRGWLSGEVLEQELRYWKEQLRDAPPLLELPTDRPRPAVESFRGAMLPVSLSGQLVTGLRELSRRKG